VSAHRVPRQELAKHACWPARCISCSIQVSSRVTAHHKLPCYLERQRFFISSSLVTTSHYLHQALNP
jgi:hypothetical protein